MCLCKKLFVRVKTTLIVGEEKMRLGEETGFNMLFSVCFNQMLAILELNSFFQWAALCQNNFMEILGANSPLLRVLCLFH